MDRVLRYADTDALEAMKQMAAHEIYGSMLGVQTAVTHNAREIKQHCHHITQHTKPHHTVSHRFIINTSALLHSR